MTENATHDRACVCCGAGLAPGKLAYCGDVCRERMRGRRRTEAKRAERPARLCEACGVPLENRHQHWCGECRARRKAAQRESQARKQGERWESLLRDPEWEIPASTVGALHELLVASDLLRRGYEVYRALSPASSCDLLVLRGGTLAGRVEVRTVRRDKQGEIGKGVTPADRGRFDILARVEPNGVIHYTGLEDISRAFR